MPLFKDVRPWVLGPLGVSTPDGSDVCHQTGDGEEPPAVAMAPLEVAARARAEGFQQGYEEGLRAAVEEQLAHTRALAQIVERAVVDAQEFHRAVERELVGLSLAIAEKIVEREVRVHPEIILDVVRAAIEEIRGSAVHLIRLNPADHELLGERFLELGPHGPALRDQLVADDRVQTGGCIIETRAGWVDAQLASKLRRLAETFHSLLDGEPA